MEHKYFRIITSMYVYPGSYNWSVLSTIIFQVLCLKGAAFRGKRKIATLHYLLSGYISETLTAGVSPFINL